MFRSPIDLNTSPFPFSHLMGIGGDHHWRAMAEYNSRKLYVIFGIQLACFTGILLLFIMGVVISLMYDGSIVRTGLFASVSAGIFAASGFIVIKKLLRELFASVRLIKRALKLEAIEAQKLKDRFIHL